MTRILTALLLIAVLITPSRASELADQAMSVLMPRDVYMQNFSSEIHAQKESMRQQMQTGGLVFSDAAYDALFSAWAERMEKEMYPLVAERTAAFLAENYTEEELQKLVTGMEALSNDAALNEKIRGHTVDVASISFRAGFEVGEREMLGLVGEILAGKDIANTSPEAMAELRKIFGGR